MMSSRCRAAFHLVLAAGIWLGSVGETRAACTQTKQAEQRVSPQELVERVKHKDWDVAEPGLFGPEAVPALLPLLDSSDPQVRQLTVQCLAVAGGPAVKPALLRVLRDDNEMVRAAAVQALPAYAEGADAPTLEEQLSHGRDEFVREQLALLIGSIGGPQDIRKLATQQLVEKDQEASHAMLLARVRLGDPQGRQQYLSQLHAPEIKTRVQALKSLLYLKDRSLAPEVLPLLDDSRLAEKAGPSHSDYFNRVCDVAVNMLDKMLDHPFPFRIGIARRYSPEDLAQAKATLAQFR